MGSLKINDYLNAGYPALYVRTGEQERAMNDVLRDLRASGQNLTIMIWKSTIGLYPYMSQNPAGDKVAKGLDQSLEWISGAETTPQDHVYLIFNPRDFLKSPVMMQLFRDAAYQIRMAGSTMILIGGHWEVPEELEDVVTFVDLDLPGKEEIKAIFKAVVNKYPTVFPTLPDEALLETAAENALGLTELKAENAISLSLVATQSINVPLIRQEKQLAVKQTGVLEYIEHNETADSLGGFDVLKEHVRKRRRYFQENKSALAFGLRPPKGLLVVGIAGTGKSLCAKAVSAELDLPLYKFDLGAVFKGVVGGSESAIRNALKLAETVAPCVLLIDEMEKLVAGLESSGKTDSGVTSRVIGTLISWMQDTRSPIYKIATCNTIRNLDSALFRRGRWDSVFAVDLPTFQERREIFSIHLTKRNRIATEYDLDPLAKASEDFVGAEIESVVDEALYHAFDAGRELTTEDMLSVAESLVPISKTDEEAIAEFRRWMKDRATPVSSPVGKASAGDTVGLRNLRLPERQAK